MLPLMLLRTSESRELGLRGGRIGKQRGQRIQRGGAQRAGWRSAHRAREEQLDSSELRCSGARARVQQAHAAQQQRRRRRLVLVGRAVR